MNTEGSARNYPLHPEEVTNEFLSKCFGSEIISFGLDTSMTDGGVLAAAFRVKNIEYKNHTEALEKTYQKVVLLNARKKYLKLLKCASQHKFMQRKFIFIRL